MKAIHPTRSLIGTAVLALTLAVLAAGCNSNAVAPHDQTPGLSASGAASQAGLVSVAASRVGTQVLGFGGKAAVGNKVAYSYTFPAGGIVSGTLHLDFFTGGAGGTSANWDVADYAHLYTAPDSVLTMVIGYGGVNTVAIDVAAVIDRVNGTATLSGSGTFVSGPFSESFAFTDLVFSLAGNYPDRGSLSLDSEGHVVTVSFNGTSIATMTDENGGAYSVDLDTGEDTPLP